MLASHHWAKNFIVEEEDIESLMALLLEKEMPLTLRELTVSLIERRLEQELAEFEERFKDTQVYNPAQDYAIGQKLVFAQFGYTTGEVVGVREGVNESYGPFQVAEVRFDDATGDDSLREFAINLTTEHTLNQVGSSSENTSGLNQMTPEEIYTAAGDAISKRVEYVLLERDDLIRVGDSWFPRDLMLEVNEGHMNLTEAVLDLAAGGPLPTMTILEQIGGLGDTASMSLQAFSLNHALSSDNRFDEVGPTGEVLWYLARLAPPEVQNTPAALRYHSIDYDDSLLTQEMRTLEAEIGDELSAEAAMSPSPSASEGTVILNYPHRRTGTLPLNSRTDHIFPTAERTDHVWVTLVDGQDETEYTGWVVPAQHYVYGLQEFYEKHQIPIGGYVTVSKTDTPDRIRVDYGAYRPRTEYIRLIIPQNNRITFENERRSIGATYDDLMVMGCDDLKGLDTVIATVHEQKKTLVALLRMVIPPLGRLTPQGTVHVKTIYSAINVLRRCPPGPIMATLIANPDFENVGGHYWKLSEA